MLAIKRVTTSYIQKLHEKGEDLSLDSMIKTVVAHGNKQSTNTVKIAMDI